MNNRSTGNGGRHEARGKDRGNGNGANSSKKSKSSKSPARSRSKYHNISISSSDEDDDDLGYINMGGPKSSKHSMSPKSNLDDNSHTYSAFTDSITTLPASSHFSIKGSDIDAPSAPNYRNRSKVEYSNSEFNTSVSTAPSSAQNKSQTNDKNSFNPDRYLKSGHVVPKPKRMRGFGSGAIVAPTSPPPNDEIHPYSWL